MQCNQITTRIASFKLAMGPSIKYVTLFSANFNPRSPCHTLSHIPGPPQKYVTHLGIPRLLVGLVQKTRTKAPCTNSLSIIRGGFCPGFVLSGRFRLGWILSVPSSVRIHLLQEKVKHHFKFVKS